MEDTQRNQTSSGPPAAPRGDVTPRERQILQGLAAGKLSKEIAAELSIGRATVNTHMNNLHLKLGARHAVQLLVKAVRAGLVTIERSPT